MVLNVRKKPFIFIDFDGTITEKDTIISIMEEFAPKEWIALKDQTLSRQISIRKGVGGMFSLVSSGKKQDIIAYVKEKAKLREGFIEFIQFCAKHGFEYKVLSGGVDFYIYPLLEKLVPKNKIICNRGNFSETKIQVIWEYPCDPYCHLDCGACKVSLIRTFDPAQFIRILIGDSVTDFGAAAIADRVFARDSLLTQCQVSHIPAASFNHFFDVIHLIQNDQTLF